jgi:hypothetical protein
MNSPINLEEIIKQKRRLILNLRSILKSELIQLERLEKEAGYAHSENLFSNISNTSRPNDIERMTWKDKIVHAIEVSGKPILARQIAPILISWEPELERKSHLQSTIANYLGQLVNDGAVIKTQRIGQRGAVYSVVRDGS